MANVFGNLFEEESDISGLGIPEFNDAPSRTRGMESPPRPRAQCGLTGINNQGATCYLNSLIQTLMFTPELRDALFCLGQDELGHIGDKDIPGTKVRVIPIQLQRLFARMLLKDCHAVSTVDLTESFGWTNDEQMQQHDVQELNRILFSAIESSLVGTSGKDLIQQLYHGRLVNQIKCMECGKISEREEEFLDLSVTVSGTSSLEGGLKAMYKDIEMLDGKNQYRCSGCNKLVDASKGAKLRCLPPIMTLSLLRFSFDFHKMERFKETGKFTFPMTLDMRPYCEKVAEGEDMEYELFSVVIHSGGAYGGHYHAYIRDIDNLGFWVAPEEQEIILPPDPGSGKTDFIECDSPVELVKFILSKQKNKGMPVDKLGQEILTKTGMSWNKRFKQRYGPMSKFISKHDDKFIFDPSHNHISLKVYSNNSSLSDQTNSHNTQPPSQPHSNMGKIESDRSGDKSHDTSEKHSGKDHNEKGDHLKKKNQKQIPHPGKAWFDFNDSRVQPIYEKELEKQYSGKESAYMLFYRKKTLIRPNKAFKNKLYNLPERFIHETEADNQLLAGQREAYETAVNSLQLKVHFAVSFQYREGALKPKPVHGEWKEITIDQRKNTSDLYLLVRDFGAHLIQGDNFQINKYTELPAGGHLYDIVPEADDLSLQYLNIVDETKLFVWDGVSVDGQAIPTGLETEPVFLSVIYGDGLKFSQGYSKSMTIQEVMIVICDIIRSDARDLSLQRVFGNKNQYDVKVTPFTLAEYLKTLKELEFKDGDQLLAKDKSSLRGGDRGDNNKLPEFVCLGSCPVILRVTQYNRDRNPGNSPMLTDQSITSTIFSSKFLIHVISKCNSGQTVQETSPDIKFEVDRDITVGEVKMMAITKFGLVSIPDGGRLRLDHDSLGLRQPFHEETTVFEAGITQGSRLVLEPGPAPLSDEITVSFITDSSATGPDVSEIIINRHSTVHNCLQGILSKSNITEGDWHLRKTNWCGEAADLLDDPDLSLNESLVKDGDTLLVEKGRLPPKGFVRLPIWLYPTPESVKASSQNTGFLSTVYNYLTAGGNSTEATRTIGISSKPHPVQLGEVEISKDATLGDLKQQAMTLNTVGALPIAGVRFMRLRLVEKQGLARVLRDNDQTLRKLKVTSNSVIALQILPEEEDLRPNQVVLEIRQRFPDTLRYNDAIELIWDTSQGASLHSLKQAIAPVVFIDVENIVVAKHFHQRYEWLVIDRAEKQGNNKKAKVKNNIRQAPYHIQDGDEIGVKDLTYDPNNIDDFMLEEDLMGKKKLEEEMEEKRKQREERKKLMDNLDLPIKRRPEVGITIKVGDFT